MNVLDLIRRELSRIAADFRSHAALPAGDPRRASRGIALGGRITAYLHAEERVLYPALVAVAFALRPSLLAHQRRLKRRTADALGRLRRGDGLADAALLKLEQEMLRYGRRHEMELLPALQGALAERELRLLGGEMLMTLAARRRPAVPAPAWAIHADRLPTLWDVVEVHVPAPRRPVAPHRAGAAWAA